MTAIADEMSDPGARPVFWLYIIGIVLAGVAVQALYTYTRLSHIPGPFLARFTNIPRLLWVLGNRAHDIHTDLHRRYGPVVRFGPNMVSVADPGEISQIYRFAKPLPKSDFYRVLLMKPDGRPIPGIFGTQDEGVHRALKKPVASAYSMTNLVRFEPYVDTTIRVFCEQLRERFVVRPAEKETAAHDARKLQPQPGPCDLGQWLQMFAFDVIGELTFSKRLGFLETGSDVDGVMANIWEMFRETSLATQMPWIDDFWTNSPLRRYFRRGSPGAAFAMQRVKERRELLKQGKNDWDRETRDFLSLFVEIESKDPSLPPYAVPAWASSNITAGSDTTAILLRAIFYHLLRNPSTLSKLRAEIDSSLGTTPTSTSSSTQDEVVSWRRTREGLPYLDACIKEATRMQPSFGLPYERVVPGTEGGGPITVCGKLLPPGTVVGMSAWAVGRDLGLYGHDADQWRPERWLGVGEARRREMENGLMAFGAGHRTCMGKHIAHLETYKVVPTLLRHFDFELVDKESEWIVENRWLTMQRGLIVRINARGVPS